MCRELVSVEFQFLKPSRETKIGSRNWQFEISGVKLQSSTINEANPGETTIGSHYWEVREIKDLRNWDSTIS